MISSVVYQKLVEHMDEAVCMSDKNNNTIYANPKLSKLLGYSQEELKHMKNWDFLDPESQKKVQHENTHKRLKGESSSYEISLLSKEGTKIPVLLHGTPISGGDTIGIMTDLRQIKKQESIYKRLVENMDEAVWMGDEKERTIYANPKFCKLVGYSLDEMIGEESYIFWDEESSKKVQNVNNKKRKKGVSSSYSGNLLTKSKKLIPVMLHGTPLPDGGTIGIMTDLRALKAKEESEKILYNAVQYSTDAIMICGIDGSITSWNKGAQIIFGYKEEILKKNISTIFLKKDIPQILQGNEVINKYELKAKHKNKNRLDISVTQTPIFNPQKTKIISYLLICRDITNHRKVEAEIESKYKKIREVYEGIGIIKRQSDYIFDLLDIFDKYHFDTKSIGDFIVTSVIMLTRVDACALRLYDADSKKLKILSSFGFSEGWEGKSIIKYKGSLAEKAFSHGSPLKIMDINREPLYQSTGLARRNNMTSLLLIPLKHKGELIGSLSLYAKADKKIEIFENDFIEKYAKIIQLILVG